METFTFCRLCLLPKDLVKKSHILPQFFLNKLLDRKQNGVVTWKSNSKPRKTGDTAYEGGLMCSTCENSTLSKLEGYASRFFFGKMNDEEAPEYFESDGISHYSNVNYQKLKIFVLSLVWRAAISRMFDRVNLDENMVERLRMIIHDDLIVPNEEFPVFVWNYTNADVPRELILSPFLTPTIDGKQEFALMCGGILIQVYLVHNGLNDLEKFISLKNNGTLVIPNLNAELINRFVDAYVSNS